MSKPPKDQAARDRIRTELGRSLLVEAGAGSGKTHQMAARMAAGIAEGTYEIEHIAAVTFTRKAAAELRGRFQIALEDELTNAGKDDGRARRVRDALSKLERFFAGTIHAFCARLLRERPVEAGVAPGFTELDETEDAIVRQQAWRDYRAQAKAAGDTGYLELLDAGLEPKHFEQAFARVCQFEEVDFPPGKAEAPDTAAAWKALQKFWKDLQALLPSPIDTKCKTQERAERFAESWRFAARGDRSDTQLLRLLEIWKSQPDARLMSWIPKENGKKAKAIHDAFRASVILPYLDRWYQYVYRLTITLLVEARKRAKAEIVSAIMKFRARHAPDQSAPRWHARIAKPKAYASLVSQVEWKLIEMPLPRLQILGRSESRFIYEFGWDQQVKQARVARYQAGAAGAFDNRVLLKSGVGEYLLQLSGLLRPLIQRRWAAMVAELNRLEESQLDMFLFGADRTQTAKVRGGLWEIQDRRCFYCHDRVRDPVQAEVDHFVPWSRHQDDGLDNLVVADQRCNGAKSSSLAAAEHVAQWARRFAAHSAEAAQLASLAAAKAWDRQPGRSLNVARAIYLRLPNDARLWLRGRDFIGPDPRVIGAALG